MDSKKLKVVGMLVGIAGFGLNMLADSIADKKLDLKIAEEVAKAIENLNK